MSAKDGSLTGGAPAARQAPSAGQRWEVLHRHPDASKLRRIDMKVEPWWGRSGKRHQKARASLFADGDGGVYLRLEGHSGHGVDGKYGRQYTEWYKMLPPL